MKRIVQVFLILTAGCSQGVDMSVANMYLTTDKTKPIGTVVFVDTPDGLQIDVDLTNLPAGPHGFHIHEHPDCGVVINENGVKGYALKAGGHYDPLHTKIHLGPDNAGHKGDLPVLYVKQDGTVQTHILMRSLTTEDIKNRSFIVHAGSDNYKDTPAILGGGGARIACGIIKN